MVGAAFLLIVSIVAQSLFAVVGFVLALSLLAFGIFRTATRARQQFASFGEALRWGGLLYVSKLAQAQGWISQRFARRKAEQARIIEYK